MPLEQNSIISSNCTTASCHQIAQQHYITKLHVASRSLVPKQQNTPGAESAPPDKLGEHCSPRAWARCHMSAAAPQHKGGKNIIEEEE
jgi:hypothetical protein